MEQQVLAWIAQYGYPAIFCLLVLGIVGLPVPDETLMTFTGYLIFKGHMDLAPAFVAAAGGSMCGISVSYWLGRTFGIALIHRYGRYVWIKEDHVMKAHEWFERVGTWGLTFGYFVPGVRHFTAYAAGISGLEAPRFAAFAYSGALLWSSTFIALGYFLGERWEAVSKNLHHGAAVATAAAVGVVALYCAWRWWRQRSRAAGR
jgi:membrane protein DedA with SNARE-associated domain